MSRTSIDHTDNSTEGEIVFVRGRTVELEVAGQIDIIRVRPGRRVVVLTEEEFRALTEEAAYCPKCDDEQSERCWTVHRGECL